MPKKHRRLIYEYLFKEGVLVAKKDFQLPEHPHIKDVPNLHVIKALQSLKSRGYVTEKFAWQHYYWCLTNDGIQYLRDYLHLPLDVVPATLKRSAAKSTKDRGPGSSRPSGGPFRGTDRDTYRRAEGTGDEPDEVRKPGGIGTEGFNPQFSGMGRGGKFGAQD